MKIFGVGSVLQINRSIYFAKVQGFYKRRDSDGFYRYYIKFENDPNPVDIRDFETCNYNVVSV